ncbi:MAG TPA: hypothetical protein VKR58_14690 [Aquella sp.]|nr:hypothetical protein [Aquella sp.]
MQTIIFVWKDNGLLVALLLLTFLCIKHSKFSIKFCVSFVIIAFIAFIMRFNAVFAVTPFIYYLFSLKFSRIKSFMLLFFVLLGFVLLNGFINQYIFRAVKIDSLYSLELTDIAKVNYYKQRYIGTLIPDNFIEEKNTNKENVDKMFKLYDQFRCSDILFMHASWGDAKTFLTDKNSNSDDSLKKLRQNWITTIYNNPLAYMVVRLQQFNQALWIRRISDINDAILNKSNISSALKQCKMDKPDFQLPQLHEPMNNRLMSGIRHINENINNSDSILYTIVSRPGTYLILNLLLLLYVIWRRPNSYKLIGTICASGILYCVGYIPILPCLDYRYFLWTIVSFYLAFGLFLSLEYGHNPHRKLIGKV